jgi:hypothetical protein
MARALTGLPLGTYGCAAHRLGMSSEALWAQINNSGLAVVPSLPMVLGPCNLLSRTHDMM